MAVVLASAATALVAANLAAVSVEKYEKKRYAEARLLKFMMYESTVVFTM